MYIFSKQGIVFVGQNQHKTLESITVTCANLFSQTTDWKIKGGSSETDSYSMRAYA